MEPPEEGRIGSRLVHTDTSLGRKRVSQFMIQIKTHERGFVQTYFSEWNVICSQQSKNKGESTILKLKRTLNWALLLSICFLKKKLLFHKCIRQ